MALGQTSGASPPPVVKMLTDHSALRRFADSRGAPPRSAAVQDPFTASDGAHVDVHFDLNGQISGADAVGVDAVPRAFRVTSRLVTLVEPYGRNHYFMTTTRFVENGAEYLSITHSMSLDHRKFIVSAHQLDGKSLVYQADLETSPGRLTRTISIDGAVGSTQTGTHDQATRRSDLRLDLEAAFPGAIQRTRFFDPIFKVASDGVVDLINAILVEANLTIDQAIILYDSSVGAGWSPFKPGATGGGISALKWYVQLAVFVVGGSLAVGAAIAITGGILTIAGAVVAGVVFAGAILIASVLTEAMLAPPSGSSSPGPTAPGPADGGTPASATSGADPHPPDPVKRKDRK